MKAFNTQSVTLSQVWWYTPLVQALGSKVPGQLELSHTEILSHKQQKVYFNLKPYTPALPSEDS